ncbi:MAG: DUF3221 domain-containing protein [Bacillota bacterium]
MLENIKRLTVLLLIIFALLLIFFLIKSFSNTLNEESASQLSVEGIIGKIEGQQILLVQGVSSKEAKTLSEQDLISKSTSAVYFTLLENEEKLNLGDKVKVWYESLDTSNPAYGTGTKVEVLEN